MSLVPQALRHSSLRLLTRRKISSCLLLLALALTMALLPCAVGNPVLAGGPVSKFLSDGDYARAFIPTANGFVELYVTRGGTPQNQQTFLSYAVVQYYPPLFISKFGSGFIPNTALAVTGPKITLNVDTSLLPDFEHTICTPNELTCGLGVGGAITAEWTKTSLYSSRFTGNSEFSFGSIVQRFVGRFSETSASAQGIALGTPFQTTEFAAIGTNHQVQLTIERGN